MRKDSLVISIVHFLMTLALPALFFVLTGCLEKPEAKMVDLGKESSPDEIEFALSKATSGKTESSMKEGERVDYEINLRIENEDIIKVSDIAQEVIDKGDHPTNPHQTRFVIHEKTNTYEGGKVDTVEKEYYIDVSKGIEAAATRILNHPLNMLRLNSIAAMDSDPIRVSFHNLTVETVMYPAPDRVAMQPGCLGLPNCELKSTHITFSRADWYSDTSRDITHFNFTFSTDAPYLGVALNGCMNFLYRANGREYLVTQCQVLRDFRFLKRFPSTFCNKLRHME